MDKTKPRVRKATVLNCDKLCSDIFKLVVKVDEHNNADTISYGCPGQFYMLKAWEDEPILPRPISIHHIENNEIEFVFRTIGRGTKKLSMLTPGFVFDITGPLGNGFDISLITKKYKHVAIVAGGLGIAPMRFVAEELIKKIDTELFLGFKDYIFGIEELVEQKVKLNIASEDGLHGQKGFVTQLLDTKKFDCILCCGPEAMMKKVVSMCRQTNTDAYVSLERKMACGIGACLCCTCKTVKGNKKCCKDGPVFFIDELLPEEEIKA